MKDAMPLEEAIRIAKKLRDELPQLIQPSRQDIALVVLLNALEKYSATVHQRLHNRPPPCV